MKKILALLIGCGSVLSAISQTQAVTQVSNSSAVITPIGNQQFTSLLRKVRNHKSNNARVEAATAAISSGSYFNTTQLRMLLESFSGDEQRLELAKQAYDRVTDKLNFYTLSNVLTTQSCKDELASYSMNRDRSTMVYSYSESFRTPLADVSFNSALRDIEAQWQEGSRLSSIIDLFDRQGTYFTVDQVKTLMEMISDEGSKLHLAKAAYSKVTDPENFSQLYSLFKTQEGLNSLTSYIGANAHNVQVMTHNSNKVAMADARFGNLYTDAKDHFRRKSKIKAVGNIFADANNFYSSYQARQLILLIDGEQNRLRAAKAAYRGIIDPVNFTTQLSDLFESQQSRDELESYVNSYRAE